jgi:ABC-type polysaccharide/polyol phosphate transport system ATPase subunit
MAPLAPGAIRLDHVSRRFRIVHEKSSTLKETFIRRERARYTELWALRDVSFEIGPGEAVALVGRNGSGKSTTLKMLAGIIPPNGGSIQTGGSIASMLELGSGFHPDFTGRENVFMNAAIHGLSEKVVRARFDDIVAFAELADFIDMPVRTYSSGMQMRLAYAVAAHVNPDILLLDEVLAVGDAPFQEKCIEHIRGFRDRGGTLVFVSHAAEAVRQVCDRAIFFEGGQVKADGDVDDVLGAYNASSAVDATSALAAPIAAPISTVLQDEAVPNETWGRATIEEIVLTAGAESGHKVDLRPDSPLGIRVSISAEKDVENLDLSLHLTDAAGVEIVGACSTEGGLALALRGTTAMCRAVMVLPMRSGTLDVTVGLRDRVTAALYDRKVLPGAIEMCSAESGTGLLVPRIDWDAG